MTGLEEMKAIILRDSQERCAQMQQEAADEAAAILAQAKQDAAQQAALLLQEAEEKKESELQKAASGSVLEQKKTMLAAKTAIINQTIAQALEKLRTLPDEAYFDVIRRLVLAYARKGAGELRFAQTDLNRLPSGLQVALNQALEKQQASVTISKTCAPISDGFLLLYGDIEQNCSFEALLDASLDTIKDTLYAEIFA